MLRTFACRTPLWRKRLKNTCICSSSDTNTVPYELLWHLSNISLFVSTMFAWSEMERGQSLWRRGLLALVKWAWPRYHKSLTMYIDLCLRASLYSSLNSGRGLLGLRLILVWSSLISNSPVFDFCRDSTITAASEVKLFSLWRQTRERMTDYQRLLEPNMRQRTLI